MEQTIEELINLYCNCKHPILKYNTLYDCAKCGKERVPDLIDDNDLPELEEYIAPTETVKVNMDMDITVDTNKRKLVEEYKITIKKKTKY